MKGVVFTEFIDMVESRFGPELVDCMIEQSNLPNFGAYTAVGTYDHREILRMAGHLSSLTSVDQPVLMNAFGQFLLSRFLVFYPKFFEGMTSIFDFLPAVENHIHVEVKKLYPEAELPTFECLRTSESSMSVVYRSSRPFADLAEGLMVGCAHHFGEEIRIYREDLRPQSGYAVEFNLTSLGSAQAG